MTGWETLAAPLPGFWHNCAKPCGVGGCAGMVSLDEVAKTAESFMRGFAEDELARKLAADEVKP